LSATPASVSSITLNWQDNATNETGFEVYRSETSGTGFVLINSPGANTAAYTDAGLTAATKYYYKVRAKNAQGCSSYTGEVSAVTLSGSSSIVRTEGCSIVTARAGSSATYEGIKAFDNNNYTKWFNPSPSGATWIQYQFCNSAAYAINSYLLTSADDMYTRDPKTVRLSGSNNGVDYVVLDSRSNIVFASRFQTLTFSFSNSTPYKYYRFDFTSSTGSDGLQLSEIEMVETGGQVVLPIAPSNLHTLFINPNIIDLTWNDNSNDETRFILEQSLTGDFSTPQATYTLGSNITKNVIHGLSANTTYYFRIRSANNNGNSSPSGVISIRTSPQDNLPLMMTNSRLSTSSGQPFLILGDSPWSLIVGPNTTGMETYLENRRLKGVNSLIMNLVEHYYNGPADANGNTPFLTAGDFSTPNPLYFDNVDYVIGKAREKGMVVFLYPAYLGYDDGGSHVEGWYTEVNANGTSKMYQYGRYIGLRYKDFKNIIWVMGGDCAPSGAIDEIREIVRGIEETAGPQIFSVQNGRYESGITRYSGESWIDLNTTYADCSTTPGYLLADYNRNIPFYYTEGSYENTGASAISLRSQMYMPVLMGANGSFFGNFPLFEFNSGWDAAGIMESQGSRDLQRSGEFFKSRAWYNLVPDNAHTLLTGGIGDINAGTYAAAALMNDGSTAIIYVPNSRQLTVNLTRITGSQTHGWWYQPSTGNVQDLLLISDNPAQPFIPPSNEDWLLVLDDASKGFGNPGAANSLLKLAEMPAVNQSNASDSVKNIVPESYIYPNPVVDKVYFKNVNSTTAQVIIYDAQGKVILSRLLESDFIDVADLSRGIYLVKLIDNGKITINRMIKE
jgi:hypothetical protein